MKRGKHPGFWPMGLTLKQFRDNGSFIKKSCSTTAVICGNQDPPPCAGARVWVCSAGEQGVSTLQHAVCYVPSVLSNQAELGAQLSLTAFGRGDAPFRQA